MAASTFGQTVDISCLPPLMIKMMNENWLCTYSDTVVGVDGVSGSVENCCQACTYLVLKSSVPQSHETQWEVYIYYLYLPQHFHTCQHQQNVAG